MQVTNGCKKVVKMPCIYYLVEFQKEQIRALLDSNNKINVINPNFAQKLGLYIQITNIRAYKIDGSTLETFEIVIANFQMDNKANKLRFFQKIFLVADIKFEMILRIFFLKLSNTDLSFGEKILTWRTCITKKALLTTKQIQIINKKDFIIAVLDANNKIFVVHVALQEQVIMPIYLEKQAQIQKKAQVRALIFDKIFIIISTEYSNYSNVFLAKYLAKIPEYTEINDHIIEL